MTRTMILVLQSVANEMEEVMALSLDVEDHSYLKVMETLTPKGYL